jgi:glycosyltransferase involved in cell wall biosynthesis/cephalosporin hydroxylase
MANRWNVVPVSICMPVYNGALYIRDAIRSVLNQTVMPEEIVISDSGSSDGTEDIIREEAQRTKVKLIILPRKTPGIVANWNSTIRAASSKYIKFVFQDDVLHPTCLKEMVTLAESDERIGFVFSPRELLVEASAEGDGYTQWLRRYQNLSQAFGELKRSQPGSLLLRSPKLLEEPLNKIGEPTSVLMRRRLFGAIGLFNERMRQLVDMEMWIRLMAVSYVGYISKQLSSLRIHPDRASNRHLTEEICRFEWNCLCDALRTPTIYPLLHRRVQHALRSEHGRRGRLLPSRAMRVIQPPMQAVFSYLKRYASAFRQLRRVRRVPDDASFDEAFAFADTQIGIGQKRDEIQWLFELVRAARPRVVLEIGLDFGGTFFLWSRAAAPDAHLLAIESKPVGRFRDWSPFSVVRRAFAVGSQRVNLLMSTDSHSDAALQRVRRLLDGRPIEFLFIDGDHSRDGVWQDFNMYSALVAPGGFIAFHDISPNPAEVTQGVARFWQEFTAEHKTEQRVIGSEPGYGIGIYRVPGP